MHIDKVSILDCPLWFPLTFHKDASLTAQLLTISTSILNGSLYLMPSGPTSMNTRCTKLKSSLLGYCQLGTTSKYINFQIHPNYCLALEPLLVGLYLSIVLLLFPICCIFQSQLQCIANWPIVVIPVLYLESVCRLDYTIREISEYGLNSYWLNKFVQIFTLLLTVANFGIEFLSSFFIDIFLLRREFGGIFKTWKTWHTVNVANSLSSQPMASCKL